MLLTEVLIAALRVCGGLTQRCQRGRGRRCQRDQPGVRIGPNLRPFSPSALSGRINSAQFHSLNSAFPGQSQAFAEFGPHTLNAHITQSPPPTRTHTDTHTLIKPAFYPLFTLLQSQHSLSERSQNSAPLAAGQKAQQGGEAGRARATRGRCCSYSFPTTANNSNFLPSVPNAAAGRRPENTQTA